MSKRSKQKTSQRPPGPERKLKEWPSVLDQWWGPAILFSVQCLLSLSQKQSKPAVVGLLSLCTIWTYYVAVKSNWISSLRGGVKVASWVVVAAVHAVVFWGGLVWFSPPLPHQTAYLQITSLRLADLTSVGHIAHPNVEVNYRNVGTTPAIEDYATGLVFFLTDPPTDALEQKLFDQVTAYAATIKVPPQTVGIGESAVRQLFVDGNSLRTTADLGYLTSGAKWLYAVGQIKFGDQSGTHYTDFCYFLKPPNLRFRQPSPINSMDFLGNWIQFGVAHNAQR